MASKKKIFIPDIGEVNVHRKRRMKSMRLRVDSENNVTISLPRWMLLSQAIVFARSKKQWISQQKAKRSFQIKHGAKLACGIELDITTNGNSRPASRYSSSSKVLTINVPSTYSQEKSDSYVKRKINELLRSESERLLLPRLKHLSQEHGLKYNSASVAILRSRWGSCDHKANIRLSAYLVQLPDYLIDYVLLHELNHTKNMNHSKRFWDDFGRICPDITSSKRQLKQYTPTLIGL